MSLLATHVFTCLDCGAEVHRFSLAANDDHVCIECKWLRDIEDPAEREVLRKELREQRSRHGLP